MPSNSPEEWKGKQSFAEATKSVLSEIDAKIFGLDYNTYWELDLLDPEKNYKYYNFEPNNDTEHNSIRATIVQPLNWDGNEIVIGQKGFGKQSSCIGIYDKSIRSITWSSHFLGEEGVFAGLQKVQLYHNRLYVLDASNRLFVFER